MAKLSKLDEQIALAKPLLLGRVLAIDPSSGSKQSNPGFAYFVNGVLQEVGDINIQGGRPLWVRLHELGVLLRQNWSEIDVLIVERIPPFMAKGGQEWRNTSVVNLHKSIGAVLASVSANAFIEVAPISWQAHLRHKGYDATWYEKSDALDALAMALCCMEKAGITVDFKSAFQD